MSKREFVEIMRCLYQGYYELSPGDSRSIEIIGGLLDSCMILLAGFDKELIDSLSVYMLTHQTFNQQEVEALYDFYVADNGKAN